MRFTETPLPGAWVVALEPITDDRGHFARTFDAQEFSARGLEATVAQANTSYNHRAGTLRGMHLQAEPHGEPKLVRCTRGAVFDVIVDLRADRETHRQWYGLELSAENGRMLFIPTGMAHGFQTLVDASEVHYQMGARYVPEAAGGVRWDDPAFAITWPTPPEGDRVISDKDRSYPDYRAEGAV
jgi:dTDP-4-dehydrorhamnose 3,5-epimerase